MKPHVLHLVAVKPSLHPDLKRKAGELAGRLSPANPGLEFTTVLDDSPPPAGEVTRLGRLAAVRQGMVDRHLRHEHTHVLWADADLVDYPAGIVTTLMQRCGGGMVAPVCVVEHSPNWAYDTHGFARDGRPTSHHLHDWSRTGPAHDLDSVGVFVLIDADIYRAGARHTDWPGLTDWMSVGQFAKSMGRPVRGYSDLIVTHAHLPSYGEDWH